MLGYSTNITEFSSDASLESEISPWHILDIHRLISYEIHENVLQLLIFICESIWMEFSGDKKRLTTPDLLTKLRDLDIPESDGQRNFQKLAQRQKIKKITNQLRDIVLKIMGQVTSEKIVDSVEVIKKAFGNKFTKIDQREFKQLVHKSMAHTRQISSMLLGEYNLEVFFGAKAVKENTDFIHRTIDYQMDDNDEEYYEQSDRIFEDEASVAATINTKGIGSSLQLFYVLIVLQRDQSLQTHHSWLLTVLVHLFVLQVK